MRKHVWVVAELAAYLQGLVDAGMGDAEIYVESAEDDVENGMLLQTKFSRNDPSDADEPGIVTLHYGHLNG